MSVRRSLLPCPLPIPARARAAASLVLFALACTAPPPPDPGLAFRHEGDAALAEGDAEKAVAAYQLALAVAPGDREALEGLLEAQVAHREAEAALATLAALEAAADGPVDPCPVLSLAVDTRLAEARSEAADAVARRSVGEGCSGSEAGLAAVLVARAREAAGAGRVDEALDHYREAISLVPAAATHAAAAELLLEHDRALEAIRLLSDGLARHPEDRPLRDLMVQALSIR